MALYLRTALYAKLAGAPLADCDAVIAAARQYLEQVFLPAAGDLDTGVNPWRTPPKNAATPWVPEQ